MKMFNLKILKMKKIILLLIFGLFMGLTYGQSIMKQRVARTITLATDVAAGTLDSVVFKINPLWEYSVQVRPVLGAGADSIYTSIRTFVSNSDSYAGWTEIRCNDNALYTAVKGDTLVTANATLNGAWMFNPDPILWRYVRLKLLLTILAKTNEDNRYDFYLVAKPPTVWMQP